MYKSVSASELKRLVGKVKIIDIRKRYLYNLGSVPSSINIPSNFLLMYPDKYLKNDEVYYIYCSQGMESSKVCAKLAKQGYNVINVLGGYNGYVSNY